MSDEGEWQRVRAPAFPKGWSIYPKGSLHAVAENMTEADADRIISDHAKATLLVEAVKALEAIDRMVGNPYIAVYDIVRDIRAETDAILTRLRDVPVHDSKGG